jgi:hypothetical protein
MNILYQPFNSRKVCGPGGLYFCEERDYRKWLEYGDKKMVYMWDVEIPDDAIVVVMDEKVKTDKFILSNKRCIYLRDRPILPYVVLGGVVAYMIACNFMNKRNR